MAGKDQFSAKQFIDAIPGTGGIVSAIARKVGCDWNTARKYVEKYPTIAAACDAECESVLDLAEAKTIEAIQAGDAAMIRYYLSTKARHRGYVERRELVGDEEAPLVVKLKWADTGEEVTPPVLYGPETHRNE